MKLIDLLVRELPKHGGWPKCAHFVACDSDGAVDSYLNEPEKDNTGFSWRDSKGLGYFTHLFSDLAIDWACAIITRDQYEAALAASKQAAWDGEGLPPVGLTVEYACKKFSPYNQAIKEGCWYSGKIIAYYDGFVWTSDNGLRGLHNTQFRRIRTEAERRRDDLKSAIAELCRQSASNGHSADLIYEAIAAGKIPGVKLED